LALPHKDYPPCAVILIRKLGKQKKIMPDKIHPIKIEGNWDIGYPLDIHTVSSQFIGYDEEGKQKFETERSQLGELVYKLRYRFDKSVIPEIIEIVLSVARYKTIDVIIPVPPSNIHRSFQPVFEIAKSLGEKLNLPVLSDVVQKIKNTSELKNIGDFEQRSGILSDAFSISSDAAIRGKTVMLFDDLYRSGSTLTAITRVLYDQGHVQKVKVLTLTKTRSKS